MTRPEDLQAMSRPSRACSGEQIFGEFHGGELAAKRKREGGSTFTFTLPGA